MAGELVSLLYLMFQDVLTPVKGQCFPLCSRSHCHQRLFYYFHLFLVFVHFFFSLEHCEPHTDMSEYLPPKIKIKTACTPPLLSLLQKPPTGPFLRFALPAFKTDLTGIASHLQVANSSVTSLSLSDLASWQYMTLVIWPS